MQFKPCGNRLLAKRIEIRQTESGLELPVGLKSNQAEIIEVGPGVENSELKRGMQVMIGPSVSVILNSKEYRIVYEKDVIGVFLNED